MATCALPPPFHSLRLTLYRTKRGWTVAARSKPRAKPELVSWHGSWRQARWYLAQLTIAQHAQRIAA